jgi:hypothetical protein
VEDLGDIYIFLNDPPPSLMVALSVYSAVVPMIIIVCHTLPWKGEPVWNLHEV